MAELSLTTTKKRPSTLFVIKLTDSETNEVVERKYEVAKLSGKAAMETQLAIAEFARADNGTAIVGSMMIQKILDGTTPVDGAPDILTLFDNLDADNLSALIKGLIDAGDVEHGRRVAVEPGTAAQGQRAKARQPRSLCRAVPALSAIPTR